MTDHNSQIGQPAGPIGDAGRLAYLDVLRGLAVLAIFMVNIKAMMAPFAYYANASLWSGPFDMHIAAIQAFLVEDKWRTIFTALFGAGLALIGERMDARGQSPYGFLVRRLAFLALFGLAHLLLIWNGDILFTYAVGGFLALWFLRKSTRAVFWWMIGCLFVAFIWTSLFSAGPALSSEVRAEIEPFLWGTDPAEIERTLAVMRGGVSGQLGERAYEAQQYIFFYFLIGGHWLETLGIMLAGMWAYRTGFLKGQLSAAVYLTTAFIGLGLAWTIDAFRWTTINQYEWDFAAASFLEPANQLDGYFGAIGYSGLVGFLCLRGWAPKALSATGRMAFTNYIACSLIGTTLAYGHAGGLFGHLTNLQLMGVVAATWIAILVWSPLWLDRFRFGPLEWLWRSLTYWRIQPMDRPAA